MTEGPPAPPRWLFAAAALCLLLAASAAQTTPAALALADDDDNFTVLVFGVAPDGSAAGGEALAQLAALLLRAAGLRAAVTAAPAACADDAGAGCARAAVGALWAGGAHAALLPLGAGAGAAAAGRLADAGLAELGEAAAAWRRRCVAAPPARSLLDLAEPARAAAYRLPPGLLAAHGVECESDECAFTPEWCVGDNVTCATVLTADRAERDVLAAVVRAERLWARVLAVGPRLAPRLARAHPLVWCQRWAEGPPAAPAAELGPPACRGPEPCAFELRRLVTLANVRALARHAAALHALARLRLDGGQLRTLLAAEQGPLAAAQRVARLLPAAGAAEVRVAVLVPASSAREVVDARALAAAAAAAERALAGGGARLKVHVVDSACSAPRAYKYLSDALGSGEYGALAALAGPACGAAWADVARLGPAHALPLLAYSAQAPPRPPAAAALALLAAGDARAPAAAWAALAAARGWRRLAALAEPGARAALDLPRLQALHVAHAELPDTDDPHERDRFLDQWATRLVALNYRIVVLSVEDARVARAALCACARAGLTAAAGALFLLPPLRPGWLGGGGAAAAAEAAAAAAGHVRALPAWRAAAPGPPEAALLADTLRLWAAALARLLARRPAAADDLHRPDLVQELIEDATTTPFTGLTGAFEWERVDGAYVRRGPLLLQQWTNGSYVDVGQWADGRLQLRPGALVWATADGRAPADGSAACALQPLADALGADCRAAVVALAAVLLAALAAALAAAAVRCRRRADQDYRARVEALRLRGLAKPGGLDRWELPRERVVINRKLGTGAFGTVYGGHALLAEDRGWSAVAVKTLKAGATTDEKLDFLSEAEAMKRFDHKNVVRLLGVVTKTEPVCTVMEFMLYGDLKNYLLARRHLALAGAEAGAADEVSPRRLTAVALDVARALSYLAQLRYVHRDVAARNCLVSANRVVKLADFGMTRLVFENDYYRFSRKGMLPVRWMAPESLALGVFSPASDVWSFGVLLYEIVTFGSLPFQGLSNSEVLARVKAGRTLDLPPGLKPQLEGLILSCWRQEAKARPAAAEVAAFLAEAPRLLAPCLDVPLDALALDDDRDRAEARWVSWAAPPSAATDTTYLSAEPPHEADAFLP